MLRVAQAIGKEALQHQVEELRFELQMMEAGQRLAVSLLAAGVAGTGVYVGLADRLGIGPLVSFLLGILATIASTVVFLLGASLRAAPRLWIGPDLAVVAASVVDERVDEDRLLASFVANAPLYSARNRENLSLVARRRALGIIALVLGLVAHSLALVFIAGGAIDA